MNWSDICFQAEQIRNKTKDPHTIISADVFDDCEFINENRTFNP